MGWFRAFLRNGDFLTRSRMTAWAALLVAAFAIAIGWLAFTAHGAIDYAGRPLGTDFSNVYAAGTLALHGDAAAPFDIARQSAQEQAIFGAATPIYGWHYPPFFLLVAAPLARLAYLPALVVWQVVTLLLYLAAMALLLRRSADPALARDRLWILLALGFTAVFVNLTHGHNGFLTTALFATGIALLDRRPLLAGVPFGLLAYKPQFALVIPLALIAAGRWRTVLAAAATVALLALAVTGIFGAEIWPAFLRSTHFTRVVVLEQGNTGFNKIQSVFAWARMWGAPVSLAYAAQAIVTALVAFGLVRLWRSDATMGYKGAALCLAALLTTPYSLDYDLMLLAPAIALLAAEGRVRGFAPYEGLLLAALWLMPAAAREIAGATHIPVAMPLILLEFGAIYWRARGKWGKASRLTS